MSGVHYFGCIGGPGHYLFESHEGQAISCYRKPYNFWMERLDGVLAPQGPKEVQGPTARHEMHGYTVLSFWDRSVDKRGACNSILFVPGIMPFVEALGKAREAFPEIFARLKFDLTEHIAEADDASS